MKRLWLILVLALTAFGASCQVKVLNGTGTITVQWDAPALGDIPPSEITYEVVYQPYPSGTQVVVATVTSLEQPITFTAEGRYKIGVRAKRTVAATGDILYSEYLWSDLEGDPQPWYLAYYKAPGKVIKVRVK